MAVVNGHLALPLRCQAGAFATTEQDTVRHREDQAEFVVRTRPGMLEADPQFGLRNLVARIGPYAPDVLTAVSDHVDGQFEAVEQRVADRIYQVALELQDTDPSGP